MKTKHVEGSIIACLDEGSNPSGSTFARHSSVFSTERRRAFLFLAFNEIPNYIYGDLQWTLSTLNLNILAEWTVYILKCNDESHYVGYTENFENRLNKHLKGLVVSTKYRLPVIPVTKIVFSDKYKAYFFEKYLKTGSGRAFMNKRLI